MSFLHWCDCWPLPGAPCIYGLASAAHAPSYCDARHREAVASPEPLRTPTLSDKCLTHHTRHRNGGALTSRPSLQTPLSQDPPPQNPQFSSCLTFLPLHPPSTSKSSVQSSWYRFWEDAAGSLRCRIRLSAKTANALRWFISWRFPRGLDAVSGLVLSLG